MGGWGVTPDRYELFFSGWGRRDGIRQWSWLHNLVNISKTTKLFLLNGWIWWYVHYLKPNTQANDYQVPFLARHLHPSSSQDLTKQIFFPFSSSGNGGIDLRQHPASKPGGAWTQIQAGAHPACDKPCPPHYKASTPRMQPRGRGWLQQLDGHHNNNERQTETQADEVRD